MGMAMPGLGAVGSVGGISMALQGLSLKLGFCVKGD